MTDPNEDVKPPEGRIARLRCWIESRPLTGWYLALIGLVNLILNLVTLVVTALS